MRIMERQEVSKKIIEFVEDRLGSEGFEVKEETLFREELGGDSLDMVEVIMEIEREYDIEVNDEECDSLTAENMTVGRLIDFTMEKLQAKPKNG